jgi:hypothetical protein
MKNYNKLIIFGLLTIFCVSEAYAFGMPDVYEGINRINPLNEDSQTRNELRKLDKKRLNAVAYNFYLHNKCYKTLKVTVEYIPRGSSKWKTSYYTFAPSEKARLFSSRNKYVYVSAYSKPSKKKKWKRKMINMGSTYKKYTYSLTCK